MATTYISVPFTATNGTAWDSTTVGLRKASGPTDTATVVGNIGVPGTGASARVYTTRGIPGVSSYAASVLLKWAAPGVGSDVARLALRVAQGDASSGYFADVDNNAGAPRLRIQRRVGGVDTDVLAWQALSSITSAALGTGITVYAAIENRAAAVRIIVRINTIDQADVDDTNAARINDGGVVGLGVPALAVGNEITYDTLQVTDLAAEETSWTAPGGSVVPGLREANATGDVIVTFQGRYADQTWMREQLIDVVSARISWDLQPSITIRDRSLFNKPVLAHGTHVTVKVKGTVVASGRLRGVTQQAFPPEGNEYEVACPKELAQDVLVLDPRSGSNVVTWNVDERSTQYDPLRQGKTIADIITWIVDQFGGELRSVGAAPASGDIIAPGALSALTAEIPNLSLSGDVTRCVESLLRYAPNLGWKIDPGTLQWSFPDRSAGAKRDINIGSAHVLGTLGVSPKSNYTRVLITGQANPGVTTISLTGGDLVEGWDTSLNTTYTRAKSWRGRETFTITGSGIVGGLIYIDVDGALSDITANEWKDAGLVIDAPSPAAGEYRVRSNTGGATPRFTLNRATWIGAAPNVGDTGYAGNGMQNAKNNGFNDAFRAFDLTDSTKGLPPGGCYEARIVNLDPSGTGYTISKTRATVERFADQSTLPASYGTRLVLDTPAVKPTGSSPATEDACAEGDTTQAFNIEVDFPAATLDLSTNDEGVIESPTLLVPASGYRGTAYSLNASLWDGGGEPGLGDMGCRRTLTINDPLFDGSAPMVSIYTTLANNMLKVLGALARTGTFRISGLLNVWADITQRVTLSGGGRTTGYEAANDLWVMGVEFDFIGNTTTVYVGTLSSAGGYDIQAVRDEFTSKIRVDTQRRDLGEVQRLHDCLRNNLAGGYVGAPDPTPIPDCQVTTRDSRGNPATAEDVRLTEATCTPNSWAASAVCTDFPCGTSTAGPFIANSTAAANVTVHDEQTEAMSTIPGGDKTVLDAVCCLAEHISAIWISMLNGFSAVDKELHKAYQNLDTIRSQVGGIAVTAYSNDVGLKTAIDCLDAKINQVCAGLLQNDNVLAAALQQRMMGMGAAVPLPYDCPEFSCTTTVDVLTWTFTPTVCDPVSCAWSPPAVSC